MKTILALSALMIGLCSAALAAPPAAASPDYTAAEQKQLGYCMWLSSAAYTIAGYKLHGDPDSVPKKFYSADPQSQVLLPLVNTVYSDKFTDAWNYAGDFYRDCANNLAQVPPERSGASGICMHATLIAATARTAREAGTPKEKVYALYTAQGPAARKIIDGVYAPKTVPIQGTELQTWSDCMAAFNEP